MERIRENGLLIKGIWGEHLIDDLNVLTDASRLEANFDIVLITVKSYDNDEAGRTVKKLLNWNTLVIHLQNGLGNAETLLKYIPKDRLITGRVIFGVEIEPGEVKVTVSADETVLGTIGDVPSPEIERVAEVFSKAGIPTRTTDDIVKHIWSKVLYSCSLNPLATILEVPYGFLAENAHTKSIMDRVIDEIYEVGGTMGVKFEHETADEYREHFYSRLIPLTAEHHASMLQDMRMGKPTEIEALSGAISRYGESYGVDSPTNTLLADLIKAKEIRTKEYR